MTDAATAIERLNQLEELLGSYVLGHDDEIHGMNLALLAHTPMLMVGPPGVAKSMMARHLAGYLGVNSFIILLDKYTTPSQIYGQLSLLAMKEDRQVYKYEGYMPDANVVLYDEIFKGGSAILNALLWALNEGKWRNDGKELDLPRQLIIGTSNETPTDSGLQALDDRFVLRYITEDVTSRHEFEQILTQDIPEPEPILDWNTVEVARAEASHVKTDSTVLEAVWSVREALARKDLHLSTRRWRRSMDIIRANALLGGNDSAAIDDCEVLMHTCWIDPDHRNEATITVDEVLYPHMSEVRQATIAAADLADEILKACHQSTMSGLSELRNKLKRCQMELKELRSSHGHHRRADDMLTTALDSLQPPTMRLLEAYGYDEDVARQKLSDRDAEA